MNIIDAHHHLFKEKKYLINLINEIQRLGIHKTCISGIGALFNCCSNDDVLEAIKQYPEQLIGAYYIRPGVNQAYEIDEAYSNGFKMLKVTLPLKPYFDDSFHPLWEKAVEYNMPILFHTGIVTTTKDNPNERISSWNMQPLMLEPIANTFPKLKIIIAHLGVHMNMDAAELVRMKKNIYVDLTGEPNGWRKRVEKESFEKYLWWDGAFEKVIFGTDVHYSKIKTILEQDIQRYEKIQLNSESMKKIFGGNIEKILAK